MPPKVTPSRVAINCNSLCRRQLGPHIGGERERERKGRYYITYIMSILNILTAVLH